MADALYTIDDYQAALQALLPPGRAWSRDPDAVQNQVLAGLAPSYVRLDARAQTLLVDAFPGSTVELLPEWEASLGLPDLCEGPDLVIQQRRQQVINRLVNTGGQSKGYFLDVLTRLGFTGQTITEFTPFKADVSAGDTPVYDESWAFAWQLNVPGLRVFEFSADISTGDEPLLVIADDVIVCTIDALKPAHTLVIYTTDAGGGMLDFSDPDAPEGLGAAL